MSKLRVVAAYTFPHEAYVALSKLQSEGIYAVLENENIVNMNLLYSNAVGGVRVLVPEADFIAAQELLEKQVEVSMPLHESGWPKCPKCGSSNTQYFSKKKLTYWLWLILGIPLIEPKVMIRCNRCGNESKMPQ